MRYMLMIYRDEKLWEETSVQDRGLVYQAAVDYSEANRPSGLYQGGDPLEPTTDQGAIVSKTQLDKVKFYVDLAQQEGGTDHD